jgi:hypothetical protein
MLLSVGFVVLQMWLLQMGVEDWLAGHTATLLPMAALSLLCFSLSFILFTGTER